MRTLTILLKTFIMAGCAISLSGLITWQLRRIDPFITFGLFSAAGALSPHAHFPDPEPLITWGPYKYVRNPMSKAGWTVLCGWALFLRSPSVLVFAIATAFFLHLFIVFVEEPKLERRFGASFRDYKRRVNRWIPSWRSFTH